MYVQKFGPTSEKPLKREKSKDGQSRSRNSIVLEDWEAFISSIRKMENIKKPSKMRGESWKFQWMRPCRERKGPKKQSSFQETEAKSSEIKRLESSPPKDHEDHIASKRYNSMTRYNLMHEFIPMPQAMSIPDAKAAVDKEWKKLETIPA